MASENRDQTTAPCVDFRGSDRGFELEDQDLEKLESDLKQMAQKIAEYRATLPDQLKDSLASIISLQRPILQGIELGSEAVPSGERDADSQEQSESSRRASEAYDEVQMLEKMRLLKEKISNNVSAIAIVLERMKRCIARIDKLESLNDTIHPAFRKRKRPS